MERDRSDTGFCPLFTFNAHLRTRRTRTDSEINFFSIGSIVFRGEIQGENLTISTDMNLGDMGPPGRIHDRNSP